MAVGVAVPSASQLQSSTRSELRLRSQTRLESLLP